MTEKAQKKAAVFASNLWAYFILYARTFLPYHCGKKEKTNL